MGRRTFEIAKPDIYKGSKKLRVVITKKPNEYRELEVPGRLKFTNKHPKQIVSELEKQGFKQALLVGGSGINALFFKDKLIDEVWITIEPKIFGRGNNLIANLNLDVQLKLESLKKLNGKGTLLLKYKVL